MIVDMGADLVSLARAGDRQALMGLVEAYQGPVYVVALAVMRHPNDAADMTQEVFVRLLRSLGSYRGDGSTFTSWVHRMTINVCFDALRRRQRSRLSSLETRSDQPDAEAFEVASHDVWDQPEWRVEHSESARELRFALATLPRSQRQALALHFFEDRRLDEIATAMGVPLNTVKSHIARGKERLASLLNSRGRTGLGLAAAT